jgi:hypothetical protein
MSTGFVFSLLVFYPLSLLGDGCALVSITLAATMGGRASAWGFSFGLFHAFYSIIGVLLAKDLAEYSETLGDLFVLGGAIVLLRHFLHHRFAHNGHSQCTCEHHENEEATLPTMLSTAGALSFHALASGAIVQEVVGPLPLAWLIPTLLCSSTILGTLVTLFVFVGESERGVIMRVLDRAPGVFAAFLSGVCLWTLYHALEHSWPFTTVWNSVYADCSILVALTIGYLVHRSHGRIGDV